MTVIGLIPWVLQAWRTEKQPLAGAHHALGDQLRGAVGKIMIKAHAGILAAKQWNTFGMDHSLHKGRRLHEGPRPIALLPPNLRTRDGG